MAERGAAFGRLALDAASPADLLNLERSHGRDVQFGEADALVTYLLRRSLRGERVVVVEHGKRSSVVALVGLEADQRRHLDERFALARLRERGAWSVPESATLDLGWANLPHHFRWHPRYATGIAGEERVKVGLDSSPDALFAWALLEPLFARLYRPFALRGDLVGTKDRAWQRAEWAQAEGFLAALGFDAAGALAPMRYGAGWTGLQAEAQLGAKLALMNALASQAVGPHAPRYRAIQIGLLATRYYRHAGKDPPKMRQVLTKDLQRVLAGYFGGDWLAFLAYLDETPHPDEHIVATLPETQILVSDRAKVESVAAQQGLPIAQVELALAAVLGTEPGAKSPVQERVAVLRDFWMEFDALHARQAPGMLPLWGLVEEGGISLADWSPCRSGLYRALLSPQLVARIDRLWGACVLPRWPDRIVSSIAPHALMAQAFGPALRFWHGCALTAWFVCEGPSSRTGIAGLPDYHRAELEELASLGFPVDPALFAELEAAEATLGPPERIPDPRRSTTHEVSVGIEVSVQFYVGERRPGFERLRDVVSRHRRAWARRHLDAYLRARWEREVREAARQLALLHERKGMAPSARQFAAHGAQASNHWFGGDLAGVYRVIGERSPVRPDRRDAMPRDRHGVAKAVFDLLVRQHEHGAAPTREPTASVGAEAIQATADLRWLAEEALGYLQLREIFDRPPRIEEFGRAKFERRAGVLSPGVDDAWARYGAVIEQALSGYEDGISGRRVADAPRRPPDPPPTVTTVELSTPEPSRSDEIDRRTRPFWRRLLGRS